MNFSQVNFEQITLLAFARTAYASLYPKSNVAKIGLEKFEFEGGNIIFYTKEYNEACHCHPEYTRDSFTIPVAIADTLDVEKILEYLRNQKDEYETYLFKEKVSRERKEKAVRDAADRKEFERLKKKYGNA